MAFGYAAGSNNGNLSSQTIQYQGPGEAFQQLTQNYSLYDAMNRLTQFSEGNISQTYDHDRWGNHWVAANTNNTFALSANTPILSSAFNTATNRLVSASYDQRGNQTQFNPFTLAYDGDDHQKSAVSASNGSTSYEYDGEGRRVRKLNCSGSTACTDNSSNLTTTVYVYDAFGQLAAEYGGAPAATGTEYLTADHLGSTRLVTDAAGAVKKRYDYVPFGEQLDQTHNGRSALYGSASYPVFPPDGQPLKFTSKERDAETGLDYFKARYMSSAQGRFTSPDSPFADQHPEDPQSWNMYAYVRNNPLAHVDPNGKECTALNNNSGYCQRAELYGNLDMLVGSKTRFFAAASAASQELADVAIPGFPLAATSSGTRNFLETTGQALEKVNLESAGRILSGEMTGSQELLDRAMVRKEQTEVQNQLNKLNQADPAAFGTAIKEINSLLNSKGPVAGTLVGVGNVFFSTDRAYSKFLTGVRKGLGHDIEFSNQKDREAIGNALVKHIREGGCDVTDDKVRCK